MKRIILVAIAVWNTTDICYSSNIVTNPGFEFAGNGGQFDSAGWTSVTGGNSISERDSSNPSDGDWSHRLFSDRNGQASISQRTGFRGGLPSLKPSTALTLEFEAVTTRGGNFLFGILNRDGAVVVDPGNPFLMPDSSGQYVTHSAGPITVPDFGPPPNDYYEAFVNILIAPGSNSEAEMFIDNVVIEATLVPEPRITMLLFVPIMFVVRRLKVSVSQGAL